MAEPTLPPTTIAWLLGAIERFKPDPVRVFCHPDDHERVKAACELLPSVIVEPFELMPAGQLYIFDPPASTTEETNPHA